MPTNYIGEEPCHCVNQRVKMTTSIERNFNGVLYRVSVKEEEVVGMRMVEEGEQVTLQEPRVTEVALEETGPGGPWRRWPSGNLEAPKVKVTTLEVTKLLALKQTWRRHCEGDRWSRQGGSPSEVEAGRRAGSSSG